MFLIDSIRIDQRAVDGLFLVRELSKLAVVTSELAKEVPFEVRGTRRAVKEEPMEDALLIEVAPFVEEGLRGNQRAVEPTDRLAGPTAKASLIIRRAHVVALKLIAKLIDKLVMLHCAVLRLGLAGVPPEFLQRSDCVDDVAVLLCGHLLQGLAPAVLKHVLLERKVNHSIGAIEGLLDEVVQAGVAAAPHVLGDRIRKPAGGLANLCHQQLDRVGELRGYA